MFKQFLSWPLNFIKTHDMDTTAQSASTKGKWGIDASHSNLNFTVSHLVISRVTGSFEKYEGSIGNEQDDFTEAQVKFSIDTASINTRNEQRDGHLKSDDFFNAEEYPQITFTSSSITETGEDKYAIKGDLRIRDVTREVTFEARIGGVAVDGYGNTKLGMEVKTTINRFDHKLKWNQMTEAGGMTVGKEVDINGQLQFAKQ